MSQAPYVIETSPRNYETNVSTSASISVDFSIDLESRYINDNVYLADSRGMRIEVRTSYRKKRITVTPLAPLESGKTYQLVIVGDSDLTDNKESGLRSILGVSMAGTFTVNFTTDGLAALEPPKLLTPMYGSVVQEVPAFTWEPVLLADHYEMRISKSNRFDSLVFPKDEGIRFADVTLVPDVLWEDSIYYWTVRAIRSDGVAGEWSDIGQFKIQVSVRGTMAPEDAPEVEVFYEQPNFDIELIETFPKPEAIDVPLNVKSIYFRVIGEIDVSLLDMDSFQLVGTHISGANSVDSHGLVAGKASVVSGGDGTTYIIFTPDPPAVIVPSTVGVIL